MTTLSANDDFRDGSHGIAAAPGDLKVELDDDLAARLAIFQCRNPDFGTREAAARHILRLWLTENGYDGAHKDSGTRPDALNASNDD